MSLFGHYDDEAIREAEVPQATSRVGTGQRIRVGVIERDNGLTTATTSTISNALYDLADQNSTTHTVLLPHGTTVKLGASVSPTGGSWRAKFVINNPKLDKTVESKGTSAAADMANQIDLLALGQLDKDALAKVTEAYNAGSEHATLVAFGLAEEKLEPIREDQIHVSGYVTHSGRHVGAYGQIRKTLDKLEHGDSAHFPEGITAKRTHSGFSVSGADVSSKHSSSKAAADAVAIGSLNSDHAKSLGGKQRQDEAFGAAIQGNVADRIDNLPAAKDRNAKGIGGRSLNEADAIRAGEHLPGGGKRKPGATDARGASDDTLIKNFKTMHGRSPSDKEMAKLRQRPIAQGQNLDGLANMGRPGKPHSTPSGLPLPPAAGPSKTSGGPGQRDDPSFANHRSKQSDASFGDVSKKTVEGWSDRILSREIDANPGRTTAEAAKLKVMQTEYRRRKTASAHSRGFIGG